MTDFATTRSTHWLGFANTVGWEVVVKHEVYELIAEKTVDALLILLGSKRTGYDRLCFTAGEK